MVTERDFNYDRLISGPFPLVTRPVTIKSGENLERGAVLGKDGDDKYLLSLSGAADGSENPTVILAEDVDASEGDKVAIVYLAGQFNENALTIGTAHTVASVREALRTFSIFIEPAVER